MKSRLVAPVMIRTAFSSQRTEEEEELGILVVGYITFVDRERIRGANFSWESQCNALQGIFI